MGWLQKWLQHVGGDSVFEEGETGPAPTHGDLLLDKLLDLKAINRRKWNNLKITNPPDVFIWAQYNLL